MPGIGIIAPSLAMFKNMSALVTELEMTESVIVRHGTLAEGLRIAKEMEEEGVDVIVSRGNTMELLIASNIRTPLVNIAITMQDVSHILRTAQNLTGLPCPKIAFVAYSKVVRDVMSFSALLDMDLHMYQSDATEESILQELEKALEDKADVIVGGTTTQKLLTGRTIPFISHESGESALRHALLEAKLIAYARSLEQTQTERFKAVMATSDDGIFLLEATGEILAANPAALRLLRLKASPEGLPVHDVFPVPQVQKSITTGTVLQNEIATVSGMMYVVTAIPFLAQQRVTSAVVTFQPATRIVEMEAKIRRSNSSKGMNALHRFIDIEGTSAEISEVIKQATRYAASSETVLLRGETGTGKELFAQAIHNASPYKNGPFVAVNCAALPTSLLESEFFGYEDGAFTGANRKGKTGFFELADQGTIFLDEVSGLDAHGQSRLLRVLQERSILRLGGDTYVPVNFRVIAATNADLWPMVQRGEFRQDLFFRLHVLPIILPPLRERRGDVRHLARLFLDKQAAHGTRLFFALEAMDLLCAHLWPGNVRELEHCIKRICLNASGNTIHGHLVREALSFSTPLAPDTPGELPTHMDAVPFQTAKTKPGSAPLRNAERTAILDALHATQNNQRKAAALLGIDSSTLYRKMKKLNIQKKAL